ELGDGVGAQLVGDEAQRVGRQVVVGMLEGAAPRVGDDEKLRRTAAAAVAIRPGRPRLDHALRYEVVEGPPDGGGREPAPAAEGGGGRRAQLQDEPGYLAARAALRRLRASQSGRPGTFHNISVP